MKKTKSRKKSRATKAGFMRARARIVSLVAFVFFVIWAWAGVWFVHHSPAWLAQTCATWPACVTAPLCWIGYPVGDLTDAFDITGSDVVYEYDESAPQGRVTFAGIPQRVSAPAPSDIQVLNYGDFIIGWSPALRHPAWVAYHVPAESAFTVGERPKFRKDFRANQSPDAGDYKSSGYDRGHMAPNYAIASRFGEQAQKKTFLMSNIVPQLPTLNRGIWREIEHRIADLWTARWGEIWVIVGCVSSTKSIKISSDGIDVPDAFYQLVVAQDGLDVRAFAVYFDHNAPWDMWPAQALVTIDELEEKTGFNFLADLPEFIQRPLESARPTRVWPIRKSDCLRQLRIRLSAEL